MPIAFVDLIAEARRLHNLNGLVRQHLFEGTPHVFSAGPGHYVLLRSYLSAALGVSTDAVTIVGSGRLGYSLNPNHPGQAFTDKSDIDVVIVDAALFDRLWMLLLKWRYPWHLSDWPGIERAWGQQYLQQFIAGHCNPGQISTTTTGFRPYRRQLRQFSEKWFSAFKLVGVEHAELAGLEFKGRLYRSWDFATKYHSYGLRLLSR